MNALLRIAFHIICFSVECIHYPLTCNFLFKQPIVVHISASKIKFLEAAEEMEIVKMDKNGQMREFTVTQLEEFLADGMSVEDLLTTSEKQTIVRHELENIRALPEDDHVPGFPTYDLYEGQSIIHVCLDYEIITKIYPLHDREALKKLGRKWYLSVFRKQPFGEYTEVVSSILIIQEAYLKRIRL